jgi:PAS domain S-box-containing protein
MDAPTVQSLVEDFHRLTGVGLAIVDRHRRILVSVGWQDICTRFHRAEPRTARRCAQSDLTLAGAVPKGQYRAHRCLNGLWDLVTPLYAGTIRVGDIYAGQFFYDDEVVDRQAFADQARTFGFDPDGYLAALDRVPRYSRERVHAFMGFLMKFSGLLAELALSRIRATVAAREGRRAGAALRESEQKLNQLIGNLPGFVYRGGTDGDWALSYLSGGFRDFTGYPPEEFIEHRRRTYNDLIQPDYREPLRLRWLEALRERTVYEEEYPIVTASGETRWAWERGRGVYDGDQRLLWGEGFITDITERKAQELELKRVNRLYNLLSQLGQCLVRVQTREDLMARFCAIAVTAGGFPLVWVAWLDPATRVVTPLAKAGAAAGYLDGVRFRTDDGSEGQGPLGTCLREGRTVVCRDLAQASVPGPRRARAEAYRLRCAAAFPVHLGGETVGAFVVYARDLDAFRDPDVVLLEEAASSLSFGLDRFAAKAEKARLQAQLLQAQKMESLGTLAGGIAHDMNNVLGAILGLASMGLEDPALPAPARTAFGTIMKAAERGGRMVRNLLGFARQTPSEQRVLDVNEVLLEVVRLLECTTLARVRLVQDLADDLRPIQGDGGALAHAFMNLCINAVDAMPDGGTLLLRTRNLEPGRIEVQVADTGCGMTPDVLAKAADPFFTTKGPGKGTGLGLAMVYNLVKIHQGELELRSEPGRGTCVGLRFPACAAGAKCAKGGTTPAGPRPDSRREGLRVLVVDDDELIQESLGQLLEVLGHTAARAGTGEEALERLAAGLQVDLVVLDLNMPGLGGAGTLPRLRALRPALPVLLATGRTDRDVLALVASDRHAALLPKPFTMAEFKEHLGALLPWTGPGMVHFPAEPGRIKQ